jgi:hypothetical protein
VAFTLLASYLISYDQGREFFTISDLLYMA